VVSQHTGLTNFFALITIIFANDYIF